MGDLPPFKPLKDRYNVVRVMAAAALGTIGPAAAPAVPALIEALDNSQSVRTMVSLALAAIGPEAVPALVKALRFGSAVVCEEAVDALRMMGPKARPAVPALEALRKRGDAGVQAAVDKALAAILAGGGGAGSPP